MSLSPLLKKGSCAYLTRRHTRHPRNLGKKGTKESHSVYFCIMPICAGSCSPSRACSLPMAAELSIETSRMLPQTIWTCSGAKLLLASTETPGTDIEHLQSSFYKKACFKQGEIMFMNFPIFSCTHPTPVHDWSLWSPTIVTLFWMYIPLLSRTCSASSPSFC